MLTVKQLRQALGAHDRQRAYVFSDSTGIHEDVPTLWGVLAALSRKDITPTLDDDVHKVAYAISRCLIDKTLPDSDTERILQYDLYRSLSLVTQVHLECRDYTIEDISERWLIQFSREL